MKSVKDLNEKYIGGSFDVYRQRLTSLEGCPEIVAGYFDCNANYLKSLEGCPRYVGGDFDCEGNRLKNLKDIHKQINYIGGRFNADGNPITSHVLGLLLIKGLGGVYLDNKKVTAILNKYLPSKGMESVLLAQDELIEAGYEEYAQL